MSILSSILKEPDDGTKIVILEEVGNYRLIFRDDDEGRSRQGQADENWFDEGSYDDGDPLGWREITSYATAAFSVSPKPIAVVTP